MSGSAGVPPALADKLDETRARWESAVMSLTSGTAAGTEQLLYILEDFPAFMKKYGTESIVTLSGKIQLGDRGPLPYFFPCLEQAATFLEQRVRQAPHTSHTQVVTFMVAYESITKCIPRTRPHEQEQLNSMARLSRTRLAIQHLILAMLDSLAFSTSSIDAVKVLCGVGTSPNSPADAILTWRTLPPYGRQGTAAYRLLLEYLECLDEEEAVNWKSSISYLLSEPRDVRRAAELLIWHAMPNITPPYRHLPVRSLTHSETELLLHRCADGIPANEAWELITNDKRIRTAAVETREMPNDSRRRQTQPGAELISRWYHSYTLGFEVKLNNDQLLYVDQREEELTGIVRRLAVAGTGAEDIPVCPVTRNFNAQWGCRVSNGAVIWFSTRPTSGVPKTLEFAWHNNAEELLHVQSLGNIPDSIRVEVEGTRTKAYRDDVGSESMVAFVTRLLTTTLQMEPYEDLLANLEQALYVYPGLCEHILSEKPPDARRFHPESLLVLFRAMTRKSVTIHDMIFGGGGWLVSHARKRPCINLITLIGGAFENSIVLLPVDALTAIRAVSNYEIKGGGDPVGVLQCLNAVTRHDFDGCWSWLNGYREETYSSAFVISNHHIMLDHACFHGAEVTSVLYSGPNLTFKITLREKVLLRSQPLINLNDDLEEGAFVVLTITLTQKEAANRSCDVVSGTWSSNRGYENEMPTEFIREGTVTQTVGWGKRAVTSCAQVLEDMATGWDASKFNTSGGAFCVIKRVINDRPLVSDNAYQTFVLRLWNKITLQMVKSQKFKLHELDTWVLAEPQNGELSKLKGIRQEAARCLLKNYYSTRKVDWVGVPISLDSLTPLCPMYPETAEFSSMVIEASSELQARLNNHQVSRSQLKVIEKYDTVLRGNGLVFPQELNFDAPKNGIERNARILRELIDKWKVGEADDLLSNLEDNLRQRDIVELAALERCCKESSEILAPALHLADSTSSPFLKAHFLVTMGNKATPLHKFADAFKRACKKVGNISLDTCIKDAVADLHPPEGNFTEGRKDQEERLLRSLGCSPAVVEALLCGALPLRFALHDLQSFRTLATNAPLDLRLHSQFFCGEDEILLKLASDAISLKNAVAHVQRVYEASAGCNHKVLQVIKVVLECSNLIRFTRENPEAQDAGLSSVLSNSRDMQHASFQTFLDCCNYINPFVAASAEHVALYEEQQHKIEAGEEPGVILRAPVNNSSSWADVTDPQGEDPRTMGFWESLNNAFGDTGFENIAAVQDMLLKTSEEDQIKELEKMIKEQNGTTDKLIESCRTIAGLPHENTSATHAALMVIHLPPTGQPRLDCISEEGTRKGAEYQDLVYRATLQRDLSDVLAAFVSQAREVLRSFNAACQVFSEGHLEFRSRKLTFWHHDASRITGILQALQGQWAGGDEIKAKHPEKLESSEEQSVFFEACKAYPQLACISPAELVRMAELMRGVCSVGDITVDEARKLTRKWREGRMKRLHRGARCAADERIEAQQMMDRIEPWPTPYTELPTLADIRNSGDDVLLRLEGAGEADGEYCQGLWTYRRHSDNAMACPVNGGWVVYDGNMQRILVSVGTHNGVTEPWKMGDWKEANGHGDLPHLRSLNVRVQEDDGRLIQQPWPQDTPTREEDISVVDVNSLDGLEVNIVNQALWITAVKREEGMIWESVGFERGMRIVAVDFDRADPKQLLTMLNTASVSKKKYIVTVVPAWIWWAVSSDIDTQPSGRCVVKARASMPSALAVSPAVENLWRVKVGGDVFGMRVGLCTRDIDHMSGKADSETNKAKAWWYMRCGTLRHNGKDVKATRPFRKGDIITVNRVGRNIQFWLNGDKLDAEFTNVDESTLRPVVYLCRKTASAEISPGAPVTSVVKWNPVRKSDLLELEDDGSTVCRRVTESGTYGAAIGDVVFRGPGPHSFTFQVESRMFAECLFGVAPPAVFLDRQYEKETSFFGLTIRSDGNILGLKDNSILLSVPKTGAFAQDDKITFILDLGVAGSIEILKNGVRVMHSSMIDDFPKAKGPLVPYCVFSSTPQAVKCKLVDNSPQPGLAGQRPSVVVKGCIPEKYDAHSRTKPVPRVDPNGVYERYLPTYIRKDGDFVIYHWNNRWCVADAVDRPIAWSDECHGGVPLGSKAQRWSVVQDYKRIPKWIRVVPPGPCAGLLKEKGVVNGRIAYETEDASLRLEWNATLNRWLVKKGGDKSNKALFVSTEPASLPHHCTVWAWGNGTSWAVDERICVVACDDEPLKQDMNNTWWAKHEYGKGWDSVGRPTVLDKIPEPRCSLGTSITPVGGPVGWKCATCQTVNEAGLGKCSTCDGNKPTTVGEQSVLDSMTDQELAGWHIIQNATGTSCRAPQLRLLLEETARGSTSGLELVMEDTKSREAVVSDVRASAEMQLSKIGKLLQKLKSTRGDPLVANNYYAEEAKFGEMQSKTIEGNIVDTSRLPVADRRVFGLSLFKGNLLPFHALDCYATTPPEDVRAFIVFYKLMKKGRLVVFNLQELGPDLQNEIRKVAEEGHVEKQLIALITEGTGTDETVDFVDTQACDVRWRKYAHARVAELKKFETITYFDHPPGTGKSLTIEKMVQDGEWGDLVPTRLDLDSTKTTMEEVCAKLMAPLRATQGLLIINVGHDTNPSIVNRVLDGLSIFGRITSYSGLTVSTPPQGWHLVIEFQQPPEQQPGNNTSHMWRTPSGGSDITLLSCRGLATQGVLLPYDMSLVDKGKEALEFIADTIGGYPEDKEVTLRMLSLGITQYPDEEQEAERETVDKTLAKASARLMTRALRFLALQYKTFSKCTKQSYRSAGEKELCALVAFSMRHEMRHFVNPSDPNHFHLKMHVTSRPSMMQLSGSISPELADAVAGWKEEVKRLTQSSTRGPQPASDVMLFETKPLHKLIELLAEEISLKINICSQTLANKNYVLIPDFLQKLIQLSCHVDLHDPVVLQGPSGTGKSYTVHMLAELMQIPAPSSSNMRKGYINTEAELYSFLRLNAGVKKLFPNNISDQVGDRKNVMWGAECRFAYDKCKECLKILVERRCMAGLQLVCRAVNDSLGPIINDDTTNPEIANIKKDKEPFRKATTFVLGGEAEQLKNAERIEELSDCIISIAKELSGIAGGFLTLQVTHCIEAALLSSEMEELVGSEFKMIKQIISSRPKVDAALSWARDAVKRAGVNGAALVKLVRGHMRSQIKKSPLLQPKPELVRALAEGDGVNGPDGEELANLITMYLDMDRESASINILMRFGMTPETLFQEMRPTLERAVQCPDITFVIMIDEMNATNMLGLLKRVVVDRMWDKWEASHPESLGVLPHNVAFVGAVNPAKKEVTLEGEVTISEQQTVGEDVLGFDVTPMPPSLMEHIVPWRQLAEGQRELFISRLIGANKNLFHFHVPQMQVKTLSSMLLNAHRFVQKIYMRKRSTVSQRDIHRAMKVFDFFFQRERDYINLSGEKTNDVWDRALSSMILGIAVSYYFRLAPSDRAQLSAEMTELIQTEADQARLQGKPFRPLPVGVTFASVIQRAVNFFCGPHLNLPEAVYAHNGLMENLFVQMVCFDNRLAVVLHGPPGTSKTLSNNIIRDNMTGRGEFWNTLCNISEVCRYQGSSQSSAEEIKKKCEEAYKGQKSHDAHGHKNKRCLLFVDEAGLVKGEGVQRKWALKVLHYYLEGANIASVLMTNQALDPAIGNRCVEVYMAKPRPEELANMCAGILHKESMHGLTDTARKVIPICCQAFHTLLSPNKPKNRWWYGLRDLFHMMRFLRRNQSAPSGTALVDVTPELVTRALERNFNGQLDMFNNVMEVFGGMLQEVDPSFSAENLRKHLRRKLDVVTDSILDNNRATECASGKNLNDMWVRFKLIVDNTDDGSALQLLRQTGVSQFQDVRVLALSTLSKADELMPVTVVSQITAAMETGKTVWLTNTREIDACLFDVFNQSYVVASNGRGEILHFVAVAIGAALEYKRVHRDFQCIVHVTKRELAGMESVLPSAFLNRLEKYTISVTDIVDCAINKLPSSAPAAAELRQRLETFERTISLRNKCVFSDNDTDTFDSIILEAIQTGYLRDLPISGRLKSDEALKYFLYGHTEETSMWRSLSTKLLQLMQPEGMLLSQTVLKEGAPAYLRAYFRDLQPWSMTSYFTYLKNLMQKNSSKGLWHRSMVYSPAYVDFPSLLKSIDGCQHISVNGLLESERGQDDLREAIYRFCTDPTSSVFVVSISPESLGKAECREIRFMLDSPPELKVKQRGSKAVVMLQSFQCANLYQTCHCTPLFGSGWDQMYIDPAAENVGTDLLQYVDHEIVGRRPPKHLPEWKDMEAVLDQALNNLIQAQSEAHTRWVDVPEDDPASALYHPKKPFGDKVAIAKQLLSVCPQVRKALLDLYIKRLPTPQELVAMGQEVAAHDRPTLSLAQRLLDEELKAPKALLTFALRFLLDDRNASAILSQSGEKKLLEQSDSIVASILQIAASSTTFDQLRRMKVNELPTLFVGASIPAVPGSAALQEILSVPSDATDVIVESRRLERECTQGPVGVVVNMVQKDARLVQCFFKDCIRVRIRHNDAEVCSASADWVHRLARGLHWSIFKREETVWSVRALCCVEAAAIDDYILTMVPLAAMGALNDAVPPDALQTTGKHEDTWITHELCPQLLAEALSRMATSEHGLNQFRTACSSILHRLTPGWAAQSKQLPALAIAAKLLAESPPPVKEVLQFIEASKNTPPPRIDLNTLRVVLDKAPEASPAVALEVMRFISLVPTRNAQLVPFVLELVTSKYVSRGIACRVLWGVVPAIDAPIDPAVAGAVLKAAANQKRIPPESANKAQTYTPPGPKQEVHTLLTSDVYTALYDVSLDQAMGINCEELEKGAYEIAKGYLAHKRLISLLNTQKKVAELPYAIVQLTAIEQAFIHSLAGTFLRPNDEVEWAPSMMQRKEEVEVVSRVAKELFEPKGFKCPQRGSEEDRELTKNPLDEMKEANMLAFISSLESGTSVQRGMGTKAMLEFLGDQVAVEGTLGALVLVCGEGMQHKCQNAEPLATKPGDLPFIYRLDDPLHDPFLTLRRQLNLAADEQNANPDMLEKVVQKVVLFLDTISIEKVRLLLFYCGFRCFFGEQESHPLAQQLAVHPVLKEKLQLSAKQQRVLLIAYDMAACGQFADGEVGIVASLMEGFKRDWSEVACTILCVAASMPETLFGSLLFDADAQKNCYLPGDRTGGEIGPGGNYKFDCVTQLDNAGNLDSYANKQPVMSTGACYLLWGIEFAIMALNLTFFPESLDTFWKCYFSSSLHARNFGYQQGLSNYCHLVNQLTERSIAYHLHMGAHTGLSVDEAQRMFAFFIYHLINGKEEEVQHAWRKSSPTREAALQVEKIVEVFWKRFTTTEKNTLMRPQADMCHTLQALTDWLEFKRHHHLPRSGEVLLKLDCLGGEEKPLLLDMAIHESQKLMLLAPLLMEILGFANRTHRMLSGRLPLKQNTGAEEVMTPYLPVLELFRDLTPHAQYEAARNQLGRIKKKWNTFRNTVGPIDFECEEGGINIMMNDGMEGIVGSAGLPGTLDFWITYGDSPDPNHKNLVKAALLSLTDKV